MEEWRLQEGVEGLGNWESVRGEAGREGGSGS